MAVLDRPLRVAVDEGLYVALAKEAARSDRPVSRIIRQALRDHLGVPGPKVQPK